MSHVLQVFQTVLAFASVVLLCMFLKNRSIIKAEHGHLFAQLLTEVVLPVVIFSKLATHPIAPRQLLLVVSMIVAVIVCLGASWGAGRVLRLDRGKTGALMIASSFGSSTLIGYPLIQYAFPHNPEAMVDAILISELGVGLPIFTLCVWVAMTLTRAESLGPCTSRLTISGRPSLSAWPPGCSFRPCTSIRGALTWRHFSRRLTWWGRPSPSWPA
jgi:predicted permease